MIKQLIKNRLEEEHLNKRFEKSLFIKRIYKILFNLELNHLILKNFIINKNNIVLYFQYYEGNNEYNMIKLTFPTKFYYAKYNTILDYILINRDNSKDFHNLDLFEDILKTLYKSTSYKDKIKIKDLNRELNKLFILDNNKYIVPKYNKLKFNNIKEELSLIQRLKAL